MNNLAVTTSQTAESKPRPSQSFVNSNSRLTYEEPSSLVAELSKKLDFPLAFKKMNSLCLITIDKELFIDTMTSFLSLIDEPQHVDLTFSIFASKGVLRLTGIPDVLQMKEEMLCLSSMMKLFKGYLLSDSSTLTLVFDMKSIFS